MANISREERLRRQAEADHMTATVPEVTPTDGEIEPPTFSVAERRLKYGDLAMMQGQADFDLVGVSEPMAIYWGMTEDAHELITLKGWVPVHQKFLPMAPSRMGLQAAPDGNVTRGKNGSEMLFMMPKRIREEILLSQTNRRQVMRLSRRTWMKQTAEDAQMAAQDASLTPQQREKAARAAASMSSNERAKWTVTEFQESHSRNSGVE